MLVFYCPMLRARVFLFPLLLVDSMTQPDQYLSHYLLYQLYYLFLYSLSLHLDRFRYALIGSRACFKIQSVCQHFIFGVVHGTRLRLFEEFKGIARRRD